MSIEVIKPGLSSLLVGAPRIGFRDKGIGSSSAMDLFAMKVSNFLVGNSEQEAVLEIYHAPAEFIANQNLIISITGNRVEARLNDSGVSCWKPIHVKKNEGLKLRPIGSGGRIYIAVKGGWKATQWLGSFSTHSGVSAGGYFGRSLRKGDVLFANQMMDDSHASDLSWGISSSEVRSVYSPIHEIRCIPSVETHLLSHQSKEEFVSNSFVLTAQCNRMGFRLEGKPMILANPIELVSSSVDEGTIQLLPDGMLIVLMADHQTTGGYPRIASVIKADLPRLAQHNPNEKIYFRMILLTQAEDLFLARRKQLHDIRKSCLYQLNKSNHEKH
jgi:antagonist of KipI